MKYKKKIASRMLLEKSKEAIFKLFYYVHKRNFSGAAMLSGLKLKT